jgi:Protein of unknown function (DUF2587)
MDTNADPPSPPIPRSPTPGATTAETDDLPLARERRLDPQRLLRIAGVTREVLEEARRITPEPGAVEHLKQGLDGICGELKEALPPELYEELDDLTPEVRAGSLEELALAHAEILGWLEGLFQGTQLALQLQAAAAMQERMPRTLPRAGREPDREPDHPDSRYL